MSARHDVCRRLRRLDRGVRHPNPECNKPRPFTHETALYPLKTCTVALRMLKRVVLRHACDFVRPL